MGEGHWKYRTSKNESSVLGQVEDDIKQKMKTEQRTVNKAGDTEFLL